MDIEKVAEETPNEITTVFIELSTVTSPSAPLNPECSAVVPLLN